MGSNPQGYQFIDPLLTKLGYLHLLPEQRQGVVSTLRTWGAEGFKRAARLADGLLSYQLRRKLMRLLPGGRARVVQQLHRSRIDWSRTQAYTEYVNPGIWINLQGRDERGVVAAGAEYEALRDAIGAALKRCRDASTGQLVVEAVVRREEVYQGPYLQHAPDLLIKWNYGIVSSAWIYIDEHGRETRIDNPKALVERRNVSGDHHPLGILIMHGRHIKSGFKIASAHIADVPATVLGMLKVQPAQPLDGRVLAEVFSGEFAVDGQTISRSQEYIAEKQADFSAQDQALVEERLRDLGYLG
jgi:predicted AlkP superfamily phosphohydrolase/phosphomutase